MMKYHFMPDFNINIDVAPEDPLALATPERQQGGSG